MEFLLDTINIVSNFISASASREAKLPERERDMAGLAISISISKGKIKGDTIQRLKKEKGRKKKNKVCLSIFRATI